MIGMIVLMCASTMTFGALIAAMILRRSLNNDWHSMPVPRLLWWNTAGLVVSSVAFDVARRLLAKNRRAICPMVALRVSRNSRMSVRRARDIPCG